MEKSELFQPCSFRQCTSGLRDRLSQFLPWKARSSVAGSRERASSSSQAGSKARSRGQLRATCRSGVNSLRKISAGHFGPIHRATFSRSWHQCFVPFWDRQKNPWSCSSECARQELDSPCRPTHPPTQHHHHTKSKLFPLLGSSKALSPRSWRGAFVTDGCSRSVQVEDRGTALTHNRTQSNRPRHTVWRRQLTLRVEHHGWTMA